jgi:hypothetical protein
MEIRHRDPIRRHRVAIHLHHDRRLDITGAPTQRQTAAIRRRSANILLRRSAGIL